MSKKSEPAVGRVIVRGGPDSPLMMDRRNVDIEDEIAEWRENEKKSRKIPGGDDRVPPWGWKGKLHSNGRHIAIPFEWLSAAARKAGQSYKDGKSHWGMTIRRGIAPVKGRVSASVDVGRVGDGESRFVLVQDIIAISNKASFKEQRKRVQELGFDLDVRQATPPMAGAHIRVRPVFERWEFEFEFYVNDPRIKENEDRVREILGLCTFGSFRPWCGGNFGVPEEIEFELGGKSKGKSGIKPGKKSSPPPEEDGDDDDDWDE